MERCTGKITDWLIKCGAIPETDRELYEYAIYSILLSLSPMLLALAIGALFGSAVQGVLTITPFVILRKFSGGYHAKSARVCFISSSLLLVLCIFLSSVIKCDIKLLVATILSAISLAYFSPLENENRLLSREEQKRYKKVASSLAGMPVKAMESQQRNETTVHVKVVDNLTNEIIEYDIADEQVTSSISDQNMKTGEQKVEYDMTLKLPADNGIMLCDSVTNEQEESSIRAKIKLTYSWANNKNDIKISNVSGSWECTSSQYSMSFSNRTVGVNDGRMLGTGKSITEHPTTNTFSYNTGWGYVQYYPQSTNALTGPRAYSEATGSINGMGGSYTIFVTVDINRN